MLSTANMTPIAQAKKPGFKTFLDSLPDQNKKLLAHYGDWSQTSSKRQSLSITGVDEYMAIRQSLYIISIFLNNNSVEAIISELDKDYQEDDFQFKKIHADVKDEKNLADNVKALIKLRDDFRKAYPTKSDDLLITAFLLHDLGKQISFINENKLSDSKSAASNERFLSIFLEKNEDLKKLFKDATKLIDIFDGLGYNPTKLMSNGYMGLLTTVDNALEYLKELNKMSNNVHENNVQAFNYYLYNKAKSLGINKEFEFLVSDETKKTTWESLSADQRKNAVMLMLVCPFVFIKPPHNPLAVTQDFIAQWKNPNNLEVTNKLTKFIIDNMKAEDPVWLYNITGLMHHTSAQGGSHFANGGTVAELFSVFYPFVMNVVSGNDNKIAIEKSESRTFNKFQMLQAIEILWQILPHLLSNTQQSLKAVNFTSEAIKKAYLELLKSGQTNVNSAVSKNSPSTAFFTPVSKVPVEAVPPVKETENLSQLKRS